jgi:carboxypeptidase Taq
MEAYSRLVAQLQRAHTHETVLSLLAWDQQVNLPPGGAASRGQQLALMAELRHAAVADPVIGEALAELEAARDQLSPDQQVVVREARRDHDRATRVPKTLVAERAKHSSAAYHAWARARAESDFPSYAPFIARHIELAKEEAACLGWGDRPYDYAIDLHDPGFTAARITALFAELKAGLVPLAQAIAASPVKPPENLFRAFPIEEQRAFIHEVTAKLGFDYQHGRLDVALHPFCSGSGLDVRMTTRYHVDEPLDSLFSSIHETGHGLYAQGLPAEHAGTALGEHAGMAMHESQSRMWENQVARSRAFWRFFEPRYRKRFPAQLAGVSSDQLYLAINAVGPTFIRVDADEIHYNLHIILRFEIEQRLFRGDLAVADLPAAWAELSHELFGEVPPDDRRGVLQDVHWSGGAFGYFPSYTLGNMIAAQNWAAVRRAMPDLEEDFARGEFGRLLEWTREHIHRQGKRYPALELVERNTGAPLSPQALLDYLRERYGELYLG